MDITFSYVLQIFSTCLLVYLAVIVLTRLFGLRSFSKMSGFDFAKTVAVGSMIGSVATNNTHWLVGLLALSFLFVFHFMVAWLRQNNQLKKVIDNEPILLMYNGEIMHDNLKSVEVKESDLIVVLRMANVKDPTEVKAVVMETTGDFSVLQNDDGKAVSPYLLRGVKGFPVDAQHAGNGTAAKAIYQQ